MSLEKGCRKDKNQNIQVFVRLRPLNQREKDIKSLGVVEVVNNREVVVRQSQQTSHTKKFTFDRAFGPYAKQVEVYQDVVSPLIEEVLAGYNCTVFAYGQTGTGKTHTMVGESVGDETHWQHDPLAGIIPRALSQLFDELRISNTEYTVRVSYLELYNEELFDLLSSCEDNSKLRIYEDVTRKGSNIVNGLEEITVYNKNEVYKIMAQGQERKRVASTLMNAQSSRSHTVFTIVVHMKENSPEGEELVKIGKLNLVDLAGSENISKAGSDNPAKRERARECVNINQSLLTLGRVITALVERHPHIPYRESKLTRILQESLGGRTKTSIIATVSPGHKDLEETMSTLEYAHRAKNIQNKPEINQKMTKKAILKEYAEEIDRLKRDLQAARDKNGVYLANETFAEMTLKQEEQRKEIQELLLKKRAMEEERDRMESVFGEINQTLQVKESELSCTKTQLLTTKEKLATTENVLLEARQQCEEQQHLVAAHSETETKLSAAARELLAAADTASAHVARLHDTVERRRSVESSNLQVTREYREAAAQRRAAIAAAAGDFARALAAGLDDAQRHLDEYASNSTQVHTQSIQKLDGLVQKITEVTNEVKADAEAARGALGAAAAASGAELAAGGRRLAQRADALPQLVRARCADAGAAARTMELARPLVEYVDQWHSGASARVASVQRAHAAFAARAHVAEQGRGGAARAQRDLRRERAQRRAERARACLQEIEKEKAAIEQRLSEQREDVEAERLQAEARLQAWVEEERTLLEERLARHAAAERAALEERLASHVASERNALQHRLQKKMQQLDDETRQLEARIQRHVELQRAVLDDNQEDLTAADGDLEEFAGGADECAKNLAGFAKVFDDGTCAISADLESLAANLGRVARAADGQLQAALAAAHERLQQEVSAEVETDRTSSKQLLDETAAALAALADRAAAGLRAAVDNVESCNSATVGELSSLSAAGGALARSTGALLGAHSAAAGRARELAEQHREALLGELRELEHLEGRLLAQEYRVYTPTGETPARQQYQFPRTLARTSPPARLLARLRARRLRGADQDLCRSLQEECIVVAESDGEESSLSPAPSPPSPPSPPPAPAPAPGPGHALPPMVKCTSESDIYRCKIQNGKENADRSLNVVSKKPSRLRAPASHKKPLADTNGH